MRPFEDSFPVIFPTPINIMKNPYQKLINNYYWIEWGFSFIFYYHMRNFLLSSDCVLAPPPTCL